MFKRDQHDQRPVSETMRLLRELYVGPTPLSEAEQYAADAMADSVHAGAPEDVEDATDDGR